MSQLSHILVALTNALAASLGRPPTAALETVYRQTESLIEVLSEDGGPASLVNLQRPQTQDR